MDGNKEKLLLMKDISKSFPGVKALEDVQFELEKGEVRSLLGENGAGKSTLIKVLGGIYQAEEGSIFIEGKEAKITNVDDSRKYGVSIIHQELVLVPHMTVAENIFLGREPTKGINVDKKKMIRDTQQLLNEFDVSISATEELSNLTIANQQMVEIVKAISFDAKILVMDEPTSSISDKEVDKLFELIRTLKDKGVGIIYVSHKMSEIEEICDKVTILRDGKYIDTKVVNDTDRDELISLMVGRNLDNYFERSVTTTDETVLEIKDLSDEVFLKDINFHLKKGEIIGFAGLIGSGRSELMESVFGLRQISKGQIFIKDKEVKINKPADAIKYNIGLVPENRKESALFMVRSVRYNITIDILKNLVNGLKVNKDKENSITKEYIDSLNIKTPNAEYPIGKLSGGNQQKAIIARWLATKPDILILDEPTRGVDVGAKSEIYAIMNQLTKEGMSIIMISSELPEILNLSDRTYVMSEGEITGELQRDEMSQNNIMKYATKNL